MASAREKADEFTRKLSSAYGDALVSAVLYGSAARGDYREGLSDVNLLVVLRSTDASALRTGSALAREWASAGNPPPLVLSETEWRASADVFPIEYSDMRDAHVLLHGSDPFTGVEIRWRDLRLQCEHELKAKQIRLREHYLLVADDADGLGKLLVQSFPTFLTLFRAGLRLAKQDVPRASDQIINAIAALADFDPEPFLAVHGARGANDGFAPSPDDPIVSGYLGSVERTTGWLDRLVPPPGEGV